MSEGTEEKTDIQATGHRGRIIGRRALIKGAILATAAAPIAKYELGSLKVPIETANGIYTPLYEAHSKGFPEKSIPTDTNGLFVEAVGVIDPQPEILLAGSIGRERVIPDDVLIKLSAQGAEFIFSDVNPPLLTQALVLKMMAEPIAGVGLLAYGFHRKSMGGTTGRRQILKNAAVIAGAWGLSSVLDSVISFSSEVENNAIKRIASRINSMGENLHPEDMIVFFRNLVIAEKLEAVAEDYKKRTGNKQKIVIDIGLGHGAVEDFLKAGKDFRRALILSYPEGILKKAFEANGGVRGFCTSSVFKLPENLTSDNLEDRVIDETVKREVTDVELEKALRDKFPKIEGPNGA